MAQQCQAVVLGLGVLLGLGAGSPSRAAEPSAELALLLTETERAWLADHDRVRLAYDGYFPPYSFLGSRGTTQGFVVDIFGVLAQHTGLQFEPFEDGTWSVLYEAGQERRVDVIATMVDLPERRQWFAFTAPYVHKSLVIMTREDDPLVRERQNLAGKTIALVRDYQYSDRVLREFPTAKPLFKDTLVEAMNAVSTGHADAVIAFLAGGHYLRARHMMSNLEFAAVFDADAAKEAVAVRSDWPELAGILDKALTVISEDQRIEFTQRWLPPQLDVPDRLVLTEAEERWIAAHPVVRLGADPEFQPFEFIDEEGVYRGIAADYARLVSERTGLNLELVPDLSWIEVMDGIERRDIDVVAAVGHTEERASFLDYVPSHIGFHRVIITRDDMPFLAGLDDLRQLRVAVQQSSSHEGYLADHSDIDPLVFPTLRSTVLAVANGEADAMVGNIASSAHLIRSLHVTNLKVAGSPPGGKQDLHFAVRKDWPELSGILRKGLKSITEAEKKEISERWVVLRYDPETNYGPLLRVVLGAVLLLGGAAWSIATGRRRQALVEAARREADAARVEAEEANVALRGMRIHLEALVEERTAELRLAEGQFRQAQKMEALGTLVGGIAHDFNNLLTGVLGAIHLARMHLDDPAVVDRDLRTCEDLSRRGADMIQQLLAFSRAKGAQKQPLSVKELLLGAQELLRALVPGTTDLKVTVAPGVPWVLGNRALVEQVLVNLVINARDALQGRAAPRIEVAARVTDDGPGDIGPEAVCITVSDNGRGIAEESLERLFEPYFSTKPPGEGTGLGLAMVYGTVRDHGGVIMVESEPGVGTTFRLYLPPVAPAGESASVPMAVVPGCGERVLLADDDETVLDVHRRILVELGYRVTTARDGQEAVDLLAAEPSAFDIVLLDHVMPRLSGTAAAQAIRALTPGIPIVFLTGRGGDIGVAAPDEQTETVLEKPCTVAALSRALRSQLPVLSRQDSAADGGRLGTILVCEDNELVGGLLQSLLERAGHRVLLATDGERALALYRDSNEEIDLLLTDLSLPRLNGQEVAATLRLERPDLPVLFTSGGVFPAELEGQSMLHKPFRARDLLGLVRAQLG